jgi:hypothetical protein
VDVWIDFGVDHRNISGVGCVEADEEDDDQYREYVPCECCLAWILPALLVC